MMVKMSPKLKEKLYIDLNHILTILEDGGVGMAKKEIEELIQKIYYNQYE
jgi:hypothetical protein